MTGLRQQLEDEDQQRSLTDLSVSPNKPTAFAEPTLKIQKPATTNCIRPAS
jgi:hypothetical protein